MYDTIQRGYYWPNMASSVYRTVCNCHICAKSGTTHMHKRHLQFFSAKRPLEFVTMDNLGLLLKPTKAIQHFVINANMYSKLTSIVSTHIITTISVACIFLDTQNIPYGMPSHLYWKWYTVCQQSSLPLCVLISVQKT